MNEYDGLSCEDFGGLKIWAVEFFVWGLLIGVLEVPLLIVV